MTDSRRTAPDENETDDERGACEEVSNQPAEPKKSTDMHDADVSNGESP